jgi:hypothetical protein
MPVSTTTNLSDVFLGSEQSKYAGVALFITILIICLSILFTSSKIAIEQRIIFVIFILIISVPSILMSLFELTCIVTGGNYNTRWWCWLLAWVLSIIIIFYCIAIIISLFLSMSSYDLANERITDDLRNNIEKEDANDYAKDIMKSNEQDLKTTELQPQQPPMPQQPPVPQQYQPPVPNQSQPPMPQQSQQMNSHHQVGGNYTGFDSKDNLSPLDTAFNTKIPVQQPANVNSSMRTNQIENIEAYTPESKMDKFSLF